ncbi:2-polyprenyl-3-methyl-5-hydroxy-6-metoxy-1,4-benzoquinol methylase [Nakamurella flavida]|nr:class I SAM-dependent methyltransferase [Nakamurella flavida]MDP9777263.1 2-polyprenyl-3-methyl-5-hydroxy-6-metoxy-1,4-benzoquinol methylase [Nakamurella flavida]
MTSGAVPDATMNLFTPEFWDERYAASQQIWSGNPNPQLVRHAAGLTPGTALDVGCGEGADVLWLARQGWQVTGLDVSAVALARAARSTAQAAEPGVEQRMSWQQADILTWRAEQRYDLVSAQFMHLPRPHLQRVQQELAAAVAPGGALLVVGHHPDHPRHSGHEEWPDMQFTAEQVAESLDPTQWRIVVCDAPTRPAVMEGVEVTAVDAVLLAVRVV